MTSQGRINTLFPLIALAFLLPSLLLNAQTAKPREIGSSPTYIQMATDGVKTLQHWYSNDTGMYAQPTDWWNAANAMTVLVDYSRVSHTREYLSVVSNTFDRANGAYRTHDFLNASYDDEGWWALAWVDTYDITGDQKYLKMAETIFTNIADQWDQTCNGGVWWDEKHTYKNAITNELFLSLSAALANRVQNAAEKHKYLDWAQREWQWFKASGMINGQHLVNDGLNSKNPHACVNNGENTWTYNQGVILGGLVELNKAVSNASLIAEANAIAHASIAGLSNSDGILQEKTVSGKDTPQFKGVFLRNLAALYKAAPDEKYKHFADANAQSIWKHDQGANHKFGALWQGPFDSGDGTRQTAALDALVAAASMK
ncbi:glycoside hydrolase family 76 protein [Acidicapsa dinghuensis]|uniref:Glycoside hydrolase family 76 protein n=1 Tax=Acidicapsa dinghuensis TaxID=2218256 RepID=A0ABW1EMP4_9BACT|nr:glycoside hydrolase family 76 protein [Acidicapsa dinghuensis]